MSTLFTAIEWPFGIAAGVAVGGGVSAAIEPQVQSIVNDAWSNQRTKPLGVVVAATLAAELYGGGHADEGEAALTGYDGGRFAALVEAARTSPDVGILLILYRRKLISAGDLEHGLRKAKLDGRYRGPIEGLADVLLSPAELANARQQEFIDDGRLHSEGALQGYAAERMDLLYKMAGLPPGAMDGLTMLRRGIISEATYRELVAEGHTKTKYTDDLLALRTHVLSATDAAELRLRGWIDAAESYRIGDLNGYDREAMDRLFENRGRPATPHQMFLAIRRGDATRADFDRAIVQSNIRPEYADWLWAIRYSYPSLFQLRGAVQSGGIAPARALTILSYQGFEAQDAAAVVASWTKATLDGHKAETLAELSAEFEGYMIDEAQFRAALTKLDYVGAAQDHLVHLGDAKRVKKYRDAVVTKVYKMFLAFDIDDATARSDLAQVSVSAAAQDQLVRLWTLERSLAHKELTDAKIRAAFRKALIDRPTALAELEERGYSAVDAGIYLDS